MSGEKYAVDNVSAGQVATDTETAIGDLDAVKTSITGPLADAEGALPAGEFANAIAWLKTLRENHERDVERVKTYATGCVGALRACLTVYENSSAEMVAEQKATEAKVVFEHGSALPNSEAALNTWANSGLTTTNQSLPTTSPGSTWNLGYGQTTSNGGNTVATETSSSSTGKGFSNSETTHTVANTSNGVTDTTAYYNSTSTRGSSQTQTSSQTYGVSPVAR